jgi:hypothetical protein
VQPADRNLADDGDRSRVEQFAYVGADQCGADDHLAVGVNNELARPEQ